MYDPDLYRTKDEIERWKEQRPDPGVRGTVYANGALASEEDFAKIEKRVEAEIADAVAAAEAGPWEPIEDLTKDVYTPRS